MKTYKEWLINEGQTNAPTNIVQATNVNIQVQNKQITLSKGSVSETIPIDQNIEQSLFAAISKLGNTGGATATNVQKNAQSAKNLVFGNIPNQL